MSDNHSHILLKTIKITGIFLLVLLMLAGGLRLSLNTDWMRDLVRSKIVNSANASLNGHFSVDRLEGDLWEDLSLYGVVISREDTVLSLDELHLRYNILGLMRRHLEAEEVQLQGLKVNTREQSDSTFNFQSLLKQEQATEDESSSFSVDIQKLRLDGGIITAYSPSYLPDEILRLEDINVLAAITIDEDLSLTLSSLSLKVLEGRLPEAISMNTSLDYQDNRLTLGTLLIDTGRSLLEASGNAHLKDSTLNLEAQTNPLSLKDILPYVDYMLPPEQLQLSLKADGSFQSMQVELEGSGKGLRSFNLNSEFSLAETPTLSHFSLSGQGLDLNSFSKNTLDLTIRSFSARMEGQLNADLENSDLRWNFDFKDLIYDGVSYQALTGEGTLQENNLEGRVQLSDSYNTLSLRPFVTSIFSERASWTLPARLSLSNIQNWLPEYELDGKIDIDLHAKGTGYSLSSLPWKFEIKRETGSPNTTVLLSGQPLTDLLVKGTLSADSMQVDGYLQLIENKISFKGNIIDLLSEEPTYQYEVQARKFNANELYAVSEFPTSLNMEISGTGRFFDPDKIELESTLSIDSSYVNGATFNRMDLESKLKGSILTISKGELVSEVLEGSFTGTKNLNDPSDPGNDLAINLQLNNLQPLASLVGATILNAGGNISGHIRQSGRNDLQFDGDLELYELVYDTLFTAEQINGKSLISIGRQYDYNLSLNVREPVFRGVGIQDLQLETNGIATADSLNGTFNLNIESREAGQIDQTGSYIFEYTADKARILWTTFDFETPGRTLALQDTFTLDYENASIRTDTLWLSSPGGTFMELTVPYADSLTQHLWARGKDFDFGVVQEILFDQRYVDGVLSGELKVEKDPESLSGFGALSFSDLTYQGTNVDLMGLRFEIASERLNADLSVSDNGLEQMVGTLNVPFIVADPQSLDDSFFERPVSGELQINPTSLAKYKEILRSFQINDTDGIFSFNGSLSGTAGTPNMTGQFKLTQPTLSGIPIDSASARFEYDHEQKQVYTQTEVNTQGQQAALINTRIPLSVDFRTFELNTPGKDDPVDIDIETNNFNLSVFNDFLDRRYLTKLRGILNAQVRITGTLGDLNPEGSMQLSEARVEVPIAGIQINKIRSDVSFTEEGLLINSATASSGSGNFNASGLIRMNGVTPGIMDLKLQASRFRLANTSDYNLTIDLDSKLGGTLRNPKASGRLAVKNGFIYLQDFGEKSVEDVRLEGEEETTFSLYDSLAIDMRFEIERNFLIKNRRYLDMEIALNGTLEAQKQARSSLSLFGTLTAQRGYARPLGKQFTLDEGQFTFSGPIDDPELFVKTSYIPQSAQKQGSPIILFYVIEGTAQSPQFRFESEPTMEQQDIVCYTLFNKPCYALESWQQVISGSSGSSPTDLLVDVLLDEVEALATQQLGIDVVQIDNTRSGTSSGTSIKTGWYLNRRTFFAIVNEISGTTPKTLFILEYLISKDLDLILTQGDDNRQGIDIQWQREY